MEDCFLKIDGIAGESQDDKHKDWIELASFSWGLTEPVAAAGAGRGGGRAKFQGFRFAMRVNKASPQLFLACASGKHIKEASLSVRKPGGTRLEYLKIKFSDLLVTSFEETKEGDAPHETIGFNFGRIAIEYTPQLPDGRGGALVSAGWDIAKNAKI